MMPSLTLLCRRISDSYLDSIRECDSIQKTVYLLASHHRYLSSICLQKLSIESSSHF